MHKGHRLVVVVLMLVGILLSIGSSVVAADPVANIEIVKFEGTIESRPAEIEIGTWVIDGQAIECVESTLIYEYHGPVQVGAQVTVVARRFEDARLEAIVIRVSQTSHPEEITLHMAGYVTELGPDYLIVNGLRIAYSAETEIEGTLAEGVFVRVEMTITASTRTAAHVRVVELEIEIVGVVNDIDETVWVISGQEVQVTEETTITGDLEEGDLVRVRMTRLQDGTLVALEIEALTADIWDHDEIEIYGEIESLPSHHFGEWVVDGQHIMVWPITRVDGTPVVGAMARVQALRQQSGELHAIHIEIEGSEPEEVQFTGTIQLYTPFNTGLWRVGSRLVLVAPSTEIDGTPQQGAEATVTGTFGPAGMVMATRIVIIGEPPEPPEGDVHLQGIITQVGDTFIKVNYIHTVYHDEETVIEGELEVGLGVTVVAHHTTNGLLATSIITHELSDPSDPPEERFHLTGIIQETGPDYIVVNGYTIYHNEETVIDGELRVGWIAMVMAISTPSGYLATDITTAEPEFPWPMADVDVTLPKRAGMDRSLPVR